MVGIWGSSGMAQAPASNAPMSGDTKGMMDGKGKMSPDMKAMMEKMSPEMKLRCKMLMNMMVSPSDPTAILSIKDQLKLTDAQTTQLEAIHKEAQVRAAAVLSVDQQKTLDAMPKTPQTMTDMHEQMMGQMQRAMGGKMGEHAMSCPMMKMSDATTRPAQDKPATPEDHSAHR